MRRKTEGLTFPTDPLAAMRDLQNLDAPTARDAASDTEDDRVGVPDPAPATEQRSGAHTTSSTEVLPTSSTVGSEYGSGSDFLAVPSNSGTVVNTTSSVVSSTTGSVEGSTDDPLRRAVLSLLAQPLARDPTKGPFTVTSIKVHQQIWERLGHVAGVMGRNKQDLVAEALLDLFAKIRREEEAV